MHDQKCAVGGIALDSEVFTGPNVGDRCRGRDFSQQRLRQRRKAASVGEKFEDALDPLAHALVQIVIARGSVHRTNGSEPILV